MKNPIIILVSLYFHILEVGKWGLMHGWVDQFATHDYSVIFPFLI
jgi:hypothetical protein